MRLVRRLERWRITQSFPKEDTPVQFNAMILPLVLITGCLYGVATGFVWPALSLQLAAWGLSKSEVSLVVSSTPLALLLCSLFVPWLLRRLGVSRVFIGAVLLEAATTAGLSFMVEGELLFWLAIANRLLNGAAGSATWIALESSVNNAIAQQRRGRLLAIYSASVGLGFAIGPLLLPLHTALGPQAFLLAGGWYIFCLAAALASRALSKWHDPAQVGISLPPSGKMLLAVVLLLGFSGGFTELFVYAMLPLYWLEAIDSGLQAHYLIAAFTFGSISAQIPIGFYLDRYRWQPLVAAAFCLSILLLVLASSAVDWHSLSAIAVMALWGACIDSMFMTALYLQGKHFRNYLLARITSWYVAASTIGMLAAPASSSAVFALNADFLLWLPMALYALAAVIVLRFWWRQRG